MGLLHQTVGGLVGTSYQGEPLNVGRSNTINISIYKPIATNTCPNFKTQAKAYLTRVYNTLMVKFTLETLLFPIQLKGQNITMLHIQVMSNIHHFYKHFSTYDLQLWPC